MQSKVHREEAISAASSEMLADDLDARLHSLEREQQVDALLVELKARKGIASSSQD